VGVLKAQTLAEAWAARKPDAVEEINEALASAGLSMETVMANTLSVKLDEFERIGRMVTVAEARRSAALQEIERHRETLGKKLRYAVQELENGGQLRVIENRSIQGEAE
jgi:ActR/RegA family two-component response regulator